MFLRERAQVQEVLRPIHLTAREANVLGSRPVGGLSNFGPVGGAGEFNVDLGWAQSGPASNGCTIQINGRTPGTYVGVSTATVAVL